MFRINENKYRFFSSCYCKIIILPPAPYIGMIQSYRAISKIVSFYKQPTECCGRSRTKHMAWPRSFFSRRSLIFFLLDVSMMDRTKLSKRSYDEENTLYKKEVSITIFSVSSIYLFLPLTCSYILSWSPGCILPGHLSTYDR